MHPWPMSTLFRPISFRMCHPERAERVEGAGAQSALRRMGIPRPRCAPPGLRRLGMTRRRAVCSHSMPATRHIERHFTASNVVRDVVIGMSDGLTVPFALAAGLTGAIAQTSIIVTAGLAEIAAGSIAMGLGGY